ncbi:retrovirus-related pol polyprotein from transposon TNT 1-94 [Tanacetum coccineum]
MAVVEVRQTLKYRGSQLNAAPVLEVENFTNWKKRFMCHIIGILPQFENIIKNGLFILMIVGQRKPENQWTRDERKAANLDQRLKSLIMSILLNDQMNSVINCLTAKSTWDDLILYKALMNELVNNGIKLSKLEINIGFINGLPKKWLSFCQSLRNTNNVKDSELASLFSKLKYEENLIDNIYFQDSPNDEEDTRSSHVFSSAKAIDQTECYKCGKKGHFIRDCCSKTLVSTYQSPFQLKPFSSPQHKPELRPTKDFKAKYNKVKAKLALLSSSASTSKASLVKNKGLIAEAYEWDKEEVSSDDNEMVEVKVLMALAEENDVVSKEGAKHCEWVKISMRKLHTLLKIEDNDDRKVYLDYLCIDLNYVEEQRSNLLSKHRNLIHELNTCKEQLLVLKQAKLNFLTMQHVNTEILKENNNLRIELKELKAITKTWLNSSNKANQCISFILPNQDTGRILPAESQRNITNPLIAVTDSSATEYDSADEFLVCSTPLPPLEKLNGVIINEPSLAPTKGNKSSSALKVHSAPTGKLKSVKIKDDPPLAIVMKELNNLKLQVSKNQSSYSRSNQSQQVLQNALQNKYKTQFKKSCDLSGLKNHLSKSCYKVLFCKRCEKTDHITCDHAEYISTINMSQHLKRLGRASSKIPRPSKCFFPPCTHCGCIDHLSNECLYYPVCRLCGSYDHDTNGHNRIISLERKINLRNPQHAFKRCEVCGSLTHTTTDHYDIEWFKRGEALQAKKCDIKNPIWYLDSGCLRDMTGVKSYLHKYFDEKRGTIFNSNKVVMIAPRVRDLYVLDMTSSTQELCFFAKVSENLNSLLLFPNLDLMP